MRGTGNRALSYGLYYCRHQPKEKAPGIHVVQPALEAEFYKEAENGFGICFR